MTLVQPPAVLVRRGQQRLAVVEEDVDPDARVRAGDARHVAERAADGRERVVAVDACRRRPATRAGSRRRAAGGSSARRAGRARPGRSRPGARRWPSTIAVHLGEALRVGVVHRRQEVRGALEQLGARGRARHAPRSRSTGWPPTKRARSAPSHAAHDVRLGRADVGHGRAGRRRGDGRGDRGRQLRHRRADDDEVGAARRRSRGRRRQPRRSRARGRPRARRGRGRSRARWRPPGPRSARPSDPPISPRPTIATRTGP